MILSHRSLRETSSQKRKWIKTRVNLKRAMSLNNRPTSTISSRVGTLCSLDHYLGQSLAWIIRKGLRDRLCTKEEGMIMINSRRPNLKSLDRAQSSVGMEAVSFQISDILTTRGSNRSSWKITMKKARKSMKRIFSSSKILKRIKVAGYQNILTKALNSSMVVSLVIRASLVPLLRMKDHL